MEESSEGPGMEAGAQGEAGPMIQVGDCEGPSEHSCGDSEGRRTGFQRHVGSRTLGIE